ncbi:GNAT family N-acetyltransferase [Limimaricola pyoseonensis]|uniref:Acetyltransferase (GNAT) family protein n=1 Tax=Limimaricola pyoseonensis TaxID=521013 RepID=A0A1G7CKL4_9RHOB|nr:GNAT family N-acetyltransferase [Limimaricola pyoseonensis]SDE39771.1 Acetyltransferase (GNAT) family protein [Limimaricola pyoseonensis]
MPADLAPSAPPFPLPGALPDWRGTLKAHYLRLGAWSRRLRFLAPLGDAALDRLVETTRPDAVIATRIDDRIRGVLELFFGPEGHVEIAISIEDAYQGRGHGRRLFEAGLREARKRGARTADLYFARDNTGIRRLVERAEGRIVEQDGECEAFIALDRLPRAA